MNKRTEAEIVHAGAFFKVAKGAPQVIVDLCRPDAQERRAVAAQIDADAAKGYRTLGVARTDGRGTWRYLGLLPLFDPPREDSAATIKAAKAMGIAIKMVTGDHEAIAASIRSGCKPGTDSNYLARKYHARRQAIAQGRRG